MDRFTIAGLTLHRRRSKPRRPLLAGYHRALLERVGRVIGYESIESISINDIIELQTRLCVT